MALHNEILEGRFSKYLTKIFSMKGGAPAPQIASEFQANVQFFTGVEDRALQGWYRFGMVGLQGAVAASQSGSRMRNPVGSNRLVVFEKIAASVPGPATSAVSLETQTINTDLAGVVAIGSNTAWDKRLSVGSVLVNSQAAPATALSLGRQLTNFPATAAFVDFILEEQQEIILSPGESIQVRCTTVNQELDVTWWWRERNFADSEATA
jgi:hypothetical protein